MMALLNALYSVSDALFGVEGWRGVGGVVGGVKERA